MYFYLQTVIDYKKNFSNLFYNKMSDDLFRNTFFPFILKVLTYDLFNDLY